MHDYEIALPDNVETLSALRLDPANAPGQIVIERIELRDSKGERRPLTPTQHGFDETFGFAAEREAAPKPAKTLPNEDKCHDDREVAKKTVDFIDRHPDQPCAFTSRFMLRTGCTPD